ncbi:MAG: hypothetical protein KJ064_10930 [Anaerolineae bacterium]|nr:hypothetical protein [Anaerolineae bacterium]
MEVLIVLILFFLILWMGYALHRSLKSHVLLANPTPPSAYNTFVYLSGTAQYRQVCPVDTQFFSHVGEFGLQLDRDEVFELWLTDHHHTVSKKLFTPGAFYEFYDDDFRLVNDDSTFAYLGKTIFLETDSLRLLACILDVEFRGDLFDRMTLEAAVWYKES